MDNASRAMSYGTPAMNIGARAMNIAGIPMDIGSVQMDIGTPAMDIGSVPMPVWNIHLQRKTPTVFHRGRFSSPCHTRVCCSHSQFTSSSPTPLARSTDATRAGTGEGRQRGKRSVSTVAA